MNKPKILAVDDEQDVLNTIKELCLEYDVATETLPLKAVERIKREKFDIFIIDFQMPVLNGIELLEKIKEVYAGRKHVSIFCTAYGTLHLFEEERSRGLFDLFVEKPFQKDNFEMVLYKAIAVMDPEVSMRDRVCLSPIQAPGFCTVKQANV